MSEAKVMKILSGELITVDADDFDWLLAYRLRLVETVDPIGGAVHARVQVASARLGIAKIIARPRLNEKVIHINGDPLDLRKGNLECVFQSNVLQRRRKSTDTTSKYKGVSRIAKTGKWRAAIKHLGKKVYLGHFDREIDAAHAYDAKAIEMYGELADINLPNTDHAKSLRGYLDDRPAISGG